MSDLISRQAVEDLIMETDPWWCEGTTRAILEGVKRLPTIDPVRHGKWISVPHKKDRICSQCESDEPYKCADEDADIFEYCPHCGAKMGRRQNNE